MFCTEKRPGAGGKNASFPAAGRGFEISRLRLLLPLFAAFGLQAGAGCSWLNSKNSEEAPKALKLELSGSDASNTDRESAIVLNSEAVVTGRFQDKTPTESHWYRFQGDPSKLLRVDFSSEALSVELEFLDADLLRVLKLSTVDGNAVVSNLSCGSSCYLKLNPASLPDTSSGDYRLTVMWSQKGERSEREPNNNAEQAQKLALGKTVDAYLSSSEDEDWFSIDASELAENEQFSWSLIPPGQLRVQLSLHNSQGVQLAAWESENPGQALRMRHLSPPAPRGRFFLVVRGAQLRENDEEFQADLPKQNQRRMFEPNTPYSLELRSAPALEKGENEPNNSQDHATTLRFSPVDSAEQGKGTPSAEIFGHIAPVTDVDWYKVEIGRPSILRAELSGVPGLDLAMTIHSQALQPPAPPAFTVDERGTGEAEILGGLLLPEGSAWIKVEAKPTEEGEGGSNSTTPYQLKLQLQNDDGQFEREPNNHRDTATPFEVEQEIRGLIHPAGDVDIYQLQVFSPLEAVIHLSAVPGLDLSLRIRDGQTSGTPIIGTADRARENAPERLVIPLEEGRYFIEVRAKPQQSNSRQSYRLIVQ